MLARRGSGSAARSVLGGFVKLPSGDDRQSSAEHIYDEHYWDLRDVIAVVDTGAKKIKSRDGMRMTTKTCPANVYGSFVAAAETHVRDAAESIAARDLERLGQVYELDNALFRQVCMKTEPPLDYWSEATAGVFKAVSDLRGEGVSVFAGTDAGPNVHVLCEPRDSAKLIASLGEVHGVREIIHARPGGPTMRSERHLS
jgi:diphosphomevalonate decarboxylase